MPFAFIVIRIAAFGSRIRILAIGARTVIWGVGSAIARIPGVSAILRFTAPFRRLVARVFGFVFGQIWGAIGLITVTAVVQFAMQATQTVFYYDWNQSDRALQDQVRNLNNQLANIGGSLSARGAVSLIGIGVGIGIGRMQVPRIRESIWADVVSDLSGDLASDVRSYIFGIGPILQELSLLNFQLYVRNYRLFDQEPRLIPGEGGILAERVDRVVESIPNDLVRNFIQGFLEEFEDAFWDVGFIIAGGIDSQIEWKRNRAIGGDQGMPRAIRITPDVEAPAESFILSGPQEELIPLIDQTLATHQMVYNRDVGTMVGEPMFESMLKAPATLRVKILYFDVEQPPFRHADGKRLIEVNHTVPDVNRAALNWATIKNACGGANGYLWGRFKANASLDNGRKMSVYGGTEQEAESQLRSLLTLSNANIKTLSITEEKREGVRAANTRLFKESTRVFPAYFTILNRDDLIAPTQGRATTRQTYVDRKARIPLYPATAPSNAADIINDILTRGRPIQ